MASLQYTHCMLPLERSVVWCVQYACINVCIYAYVFNVCVWMPMYFRFGLVPNIGIPTKTLTDVQKVSKYRLSEARQLSRLQSSWGVGPYPATPMCD